MTTHYQEDYYVDKMYGDEPKEAEMESEMLEDEDGDIGDEEDENDIDGMKDLANALKEDMESQLSENDLRVFREHTEGLIDRLNEVQELLHECASQLRDIANEDPAHAGWATAYIISHLEILAGGEHEWMSYDQSIDNWVKMLEEEAAVEVIIDDDAGEPESKDDSWMQS